MQEITVTLDDRQIEELTLMARHLSTDLSTVARALLAGAIEAEVAHEDRRRTDPSNPESEDWNDFQQGVGDSPNLGHYAETV